MSSYDQNLLDEVPKATRAQLQEGYNVDLLEQPPRRTSSVRKPPPQTPQPPPGPVPLTPGIAETGSGPGEKLVSPTHTSAAAKSPTSFWRTRKGVITVFIVVVIVIGAVVGGAVGGTVKKSNNNTVGTTGTTGNTTSPTSSTSSTSTSTESATQGIGGGTTTAAQPIVTEQNIQP